LDRVARRAEALEVSAVDTIDAARSERDEQLHRKPGA
jgi:hypothetical protein